MDYSYRRAPVASRTCSRLEAGKRRRESHTLATFYMRGAASASASAAVSCRAEGPRVGEERRGEGGKEQFAADGIRAAEATTELAPREVFFLFLHVYVLLQWVVYIALVSVVPIVAAVIVGTYILAPPQSR